MRDLISLIIANRVFVLYSQSGAGKSSLLNTKVTIGLEKEQCWVLPVARVQGKVPLSVNELNIRNIFSLNAILSLKDDFSDVSYTVTIAELLTEIYETRSIHDEPIVLIFDQFEELFSFYEHRWQERTPFIIEIIEALEKLPDLKIIFSLREDYIAKLDALSGFFPNKLRSRYYLERLREAPAAEAVSGPVGRGGRSYDKEVAQVIVRDLLETHARDIQGRQVTVKGEFVEPVQLQVVCLNLWDSVPADEKVITKRHIERSGSVDEVLRKFYDTSVAEVARDLQVSESSLRRWFENALITAAGTRGTVFRDTDTTAGMQNRVVDALVNRYLIRGDWRAGAQWYEITHDRLLRPIRESNRLWFRRYDNKRRLAIGSFGTVVALALIIGLSMSLLNSRDMTRRAEALALAANLVDASSKLPPNSRELALLLAVEAFQVNDSMRTRGNLLAQVQKADRIQRVERINARDITDGVVIAGTEFVALVTSESNLLIWNYRKGGVVVSAPVDGKGPFRLFADQTHVYILPSSGDGQTFEIRALANAGRFALDKATGSLFERMVTALGQSASVLGGDSSGPNTPLQRDPEVRRTVAFASGRLLTSRASELTVTDAGGSQLAKFQVMDRGTPSRPAKILDIGLSPDGKLAFALACSLDDATAANGSKSPARKRESVSAIGSCKRRFTKFWQIDQQIDKQRELDVSAPEIDPLRSIAISGSNDVMWLAVGNDDGSIVVSEHKIRQDFSTSQIFEASLSAGAPLIDVFFAEDSKSLISVSGGLLTSWQLEGPRRLEKKLRDGVPFDISIAPSGSLATIGHKGYAVIDSDGRRVLLSGAIQRQSVTRDRPDQDTFAGVSLARNAQQLLVGQYGAIELWAVDSGRRLVSISIAPADTVNVALDPRGRYIASGFLSLMQLDEKSPVPAVDLSHVPILWEIDSSQPVLFVDLTRGALSPKESDSRRPEEEEKLAVGVGFSPDAKYFVVTLGRGEEGSVNIYTRQMAGGADRFDRPTVVHMDGVPYWVAFYPDGGQFAVSNRNGSVTLINAETAQTVGKMQVADRKSGRLAMSPDGTLLAVVMFGGQVSLWDIASRTPFGNPISVGEQFNLPIGVAFTPDGRQLVTGNEQLESLVAVDLNEQSWIKQACDIAGRTLTEGERANYGLPLEGPRACAAK